MLVSIGGWLTCHWKLITLLGGMVGVGATATANHVTGANERLTALETREAVHMVRDSAQLAGIEHDVGEIRCMVVLSAQELNPLDCLKE